MQTQQHLNFLKEKIQDLGSAIFFNLSDAVLKFPTALVNSLQVDDFGYVWFWMQKPRQDLREFENGFPVRLDFYRKGSTYFLQVSGKAWMVTDPEEISTALELTTSPAAAYAAGLVLVKVKMMRADYHETQTAGTASWWQNAMQTVSAWFRNPNGYTQPSNTYFPAS